jgi:predicted Zn-dependent protease
VTNELTTQALAALERGQGDEARALVDRAYAEHKDDPETRDLFTALHLARAIRLSAQAREARREDIARRNIAYDTEFEDAPGVAKAFDAASAALEEVLAADPGHEKALMMKASLLFRRDRAAGRPAALEILHAIAAADPANRQVLYAIKKIEVPCKRCSDSGFCPKCRGRGSRRILGLESKCEACHGQGICLVCGVL